MAQPRVEAFPAHYFEVELRVAGRTFTGMAFRSVSGLKSETTVVPLEEGGFNTTTRKLIGRTNFPNLVLKQGLANGDLWKLRKMYMNDSSQGGTAVAVNWGSAIRMAGIITQKGPAGSNGVATLMKWGFIGGWICKWEGPDFDATKNEISIESIEIAHEGLELLKVT